MFNIALFGAGRIGSIHAENIHCHPQSRLTYIVDINQQAAQQLAANYNTSVASLDEVIDDESVDAVLIASATDTHAYLIEKAAIAGKKIFCEKPIDLDLNRVRQCLSVVEENNSTLLVGFNRRFDKNFMHLKAKLDAGEIGSPELIVINSRDPGLPPMEYIENSGGLFKDMSIHDFDMVRWLVGEQPVSVKASGACLIDVELEQKGDIDTAVIVLHFASGLLAVINNSRRTSYGYDQRIEIHASDGMLQAENELESSVIKYNEYGVTQQKPVHFFLDRYANAYKREWHHFVQVLLDKEKLKVTGIDGQRALEIAQAAEHSMGIKATSICQA